MTQLTRTNATNTAPTMTSRELLFLINEIRSLEGKNPVTKSTFETKIRKIVPEIDLSNFREIYLDGYGREQLEYRLPKRECDLLVMSESYKVQAAVYDRMVELEQSSRPSVPQIPPTPGITLLNSLLSAGTLFHCPLHIVEQEAAKEVLNHTGEDFRMLLKYSPAQDNIPDAEVMLEPTPLAHILGISAKAFNKRLEAAGFQTKVEGGWEPTVYGAPYCIQHSWSKDGKSGYNLKWNRTILDCLTTA